VKKDFNLHLSLDHCQIWYRSDKYLYSYKLQKVASLFWPNMCIMQYMHIAYYHNKAYTEVVAVLHIFEFITFA